MPEARLADKRGHDNPTELGSGVSTWGLRGHHGGITQFSFIMTNTSCETKSASSQLPRRICGRQPPLDTLIGFDLPDGARAGRVLRRQWGPSNGFANRVPPTPSCKVSLMSAKVADC